MRLLCLIVIIISGAANAKSPLIFNREQLIINSTVEVPNPAYQAREQQQNIASGGFIGETKSLKDDPKSEKKTKQPFIPKTFSQNNKHVFLITVGDENAIDKDWLQSSTNIKGNKAVLYLLEEPSIPTIEPSESTQANDILFIGSYGAIKAIAKNISPASLAEPMVLDEPVKAILYLEGGIADKLGLKPQDQVEYSAFPKKPNLTIN